MRGLETLSADPSDGEIDVDAYEAALHARLAVSGQSILRHAARMAARVEGMAAKIDGYKETDEEGQEHWQRAPVAPDLPLYHNWLRQATTLRLKHEKGEIEGPVATDKDIIVLLSRIEPLYEEAITHYYG